jgi:hypothetical protein
MSNLTTPLGIPVQTVVAPNGANPGQSALNNMRANNAQQAAATKALAGGKKKRRMLRGGQAVPADGRIPIAFGSSPYPQTVGPEQTTNAQTLQIAQMATQQQANQKFDSKAGGSRRKWGGNPDWVWPCMSGGVSKSNKRTRQMRKTRQMRQTRKMRKSRKYRRH